MPDARCYYFDAAIDVADIEFVCHKNNIVTYRVSALLLLMPLCYGVGAEDGHHAEYNNTDIDVTGEMSGALMKRRALRCFLVAFDAIFAILLLLMLSLLHADAFIILRHAAVAVAFRHAAYAADAATLPDVFARAAYFTPFHAAADADVFAADIFAIFDAAAALFRHFL